MGRFLTGDPARRYVREGNLGEHVVKEAVASARRHMRIRHFFHSKLVFEERTAVKTQPYQFRGGP